MRACAQWPSCFQLFANPMDYSQAPLSMEFFKQEYWSGLLFSSPGHLPSPGIELRSPALAGMFFTTEPSHQGSPISHRDSYNCLLT